MYSIEEVAEDKFVLSDDVAAIGTYPTREEAEKAQAEKEAKVPTPAEPVEPEAKPQSKLDRLIAHLRLHGIHFDDHDEEGE